MGCRKCCISRGRCAKRNWWLVWHCPYCLYCIRNNFGANKLWKGAAIAILLFTAILLLARNYISHRKQTREIKAEDSLNRAESSSIQGVIEESAANIARVLKRSNRIYTNSINGLAKQDLALLKKNKKQGDKLSAEIDDLRDQIFYFIKN